MNSASPSQHVKSLKVGAFLVAGSAITWSFGGTIARFITEESSWTVVFWRSVFAALFILTFMIIRNGLPETVRMFRAMGLAGLGVATCFAIASTSFVVALAYTTVANIMLMQAGVPLIAALLAYVLFREKVSFGTWLAIAAVIAGVAIMVSQSFTGEVSAIGDGLALLITIIFSCAIVITRRNAHVRMMPAVCLGTTMAAIFSGAMALSATSLMVTPHDFFWLFLFGAANLGAGLAMFVTGVRAIPAALAALIGTLEPVFAPLWVWLVHSEVPTRMTIIGGTVICLALLIHLLLELRRSRA